MPKSVADIWKTTLNNIKLQIKEIDRQMKDIIEASEDLTLKFKNLMTIPGVGKTTAIAILAEIEDIKKFLNARQLAAYIGVTPRHRISGTSVRSKPSIAKMGNPILRKALYLPAVSAIRSNETFAKLAQKLKIKGKFAKQVIVAVMRKLIHLIFGILQNGSVFNENFMLKFA